MDATKELTWYFVGDDPTMTCGCKLYNDGVVTPCPLHAAAGEMREVLADLLNVAMAMSNAKHAGQRITNDLWSDLYWRGNRARALLARMGG